MSLLWNFHSAFLRLRGLIPVYALGLAQPSDVRSDSVLLLLFGTVWGFLFMPTGSGGSAGLSGWYPPQPSTTGETACPT
jgi:hypothetical protein